MPSGAGRRARGAGGRRAAAAWLLAGFLAWRGGTAAVDLARGLRPGDLRRAVVETPEERFRRALAGDLPLYEALRATPPAAQLFFAGASGPEESLAYSRLQALLYPRRFHPPPPRPLPADWQPGAGMTEDVHVVELGPPAEHAWQRHFALVDAGKEFRLWRFRGAER